MATTTTPRKRTAAKATKAAAPAASDSQENAVDENGLTREVYTLDNRGRTRGGEGNELYWNLHQAGGARGQIFTDQDVVEVKVLIIRNPNAK